MTTDRRKGSAWFALNSLSGTWFAFDSQEPGLPPLEPSQETQLPERVHTALRASHFKRCSLEMRKKQMLVVRGVRTVHLAGFFLYSFKCKLLNEQIASMLG